MGREPGEQLAADRERDRLLHLRAAPVEGVQQIAQQISQLAIDAAQGGDLLAVVVRVEAREQHLEGAGPLPGAVQRAQHLAEHVVDQLPIAERLEAGERPVLVLDALVAELRERGQRAVDLLQQAPVDDAEGAAGEQLFDAGAAAPLDEHLVGDRAALLDAVDGAALALLDPRREPRLLRRVRVEEPFEIGEHRLERIGARGREQAVERGEAAAGFLEAGPRAREQAQVDLERLAEPLVGLLVPAQPAAERDADEAAAGVGRVHLAVARHRLQELVHAAIVARLAEAHAGIERAFGLDCFALRQRRLARALHRREPLLDVVAQPPLEPQALEPLDQAAHRRREIADAGAALSQPQQLLVAVEQHLERRHRRARLAHGRQLALEQRLEPIPRRGRRRRVDQIGGERLQRRGVALAGEARLQLELRQVERHQVGPRRLALGELDAGGIVRVQEAGAITRALQSLGGGADGVDAHRPREERAILLVELGHRGVALARLDVAADDAVVAVVVAEGEPEVGGDS